MSEAKLVIFLSEAAKLLGVSERTLRRMSSCKKFPSLFKIGKRAALARTEFDDWWSDFLKSTSSK